MNENDFIFGRNSDGTLEVTVAVQQGKKYKVSAKSKDLLRVGPDTIDWSNNRCIVDTSTLDKGDKFKLIFTEDDGAPSPARWEFTIEVPGLPEQPVTDQVVTTEPSKPFYKRVWVLVTSLVVLLSLGCCTVIKTGKFWNKNPKVAVDGSGSKKPNGSSDTTPGGNVTNHFTPPTQPNSPSAISFPTLPIARVRGTNGSTVEINVPQGEGFNPQIFAVAGGNITLQTPSIGGESKKFEVNRAQPQGFDVRVGENKVVTVMPNQTVHVETAEGWSLDWKEVHNKASSVKVFYDFQDEPQVKQDGSLNCSVLSFMNVGDDQLILVFEWTMKKP